MLEKKDEKRFWSKVDRTGGPDNCWLWKAGRFSTGYGQFHVRGRSNVASRVAYDIYFGEIPAGYQVCHKCDNPLCVNPRHLFLGTTQDNTRDRDRKGRQSRGEKVNTCKLTPDSVRQIRHLYATQEYTQVQLAKQYGVSQVQIGHIVRGEHWKHIQ